MLSLKKGSRRRFRLLSVHSHSHGGHMFIAGKRAQRKESRVCLMQACSFADLVFRVCRLHGFVFLLPDSDFLLRITCFYYPIRTPCLFQAKLHTSATRFCALPARRKDYLPRRSFRGAAFAAQKAD